MKEQHNLNQKNLRQDDRAQRIRNQKKNHFRNKFLDGTQNQINATNTALREIEGEKEEKVKN